MSWWILSALEGVAAVLNLDQALSPQSPTDLSSEQAWIHLAVSDPDVGPHDPGELCVVEARMFFDDFERPEGGIG